MYMPSVEPSSPPEMPKNSSPQKSPTINHDLTNRVIERIESALCPELKAAGYRDTWFPTKASWTFFSVGQTFLGGGFKDFLCSPLFGEDFSILTTIFQMGWFNHQPPTSWEDSYYGSKPLAKSRVYPTMDGEHPSRVTVGNMQKYVAKADTDAKSLKTLFFQKAWYYCRLWIHTQIFNVYCM